VESPDLMLWCV